MLITRVNNRVSNICESHMGFPRNPSPAAGSNRDSNYAYPLQLLMERLRVDDMNKDYSDGNCNVAV